MRSWELTTHAVRARSPEILQSDLGEGRAILLALPAGQSLSDHVVQERAYLVVADGRVAVEAAAETVEAGPGTLVVFEPAERHEVRALEDARLLLVLAPWPADGHRGATREQRPASDAG